MPQTVVFGCLLGPGRRRKPIVCPTAIWHSCFWFWAALQVSRHFQNELLLHLMAEFSSYGQGVCGGPFRGCVESSVGRTLQGGKGRRIDRDFLAVLLAEAHQKYQA